MVTSTLLCSIAVQAAAQCAHSKLHLERSEMHQQEDMDVGDPVRPVRVDESVDTILWALAIGPASSRLFRIKGI